MDGLRRGADNDENARLWASKLRSEMFAILTSTDGVYKKRDLAETRIPLLPVDILSDEYISRLCSDVKSPAGSGGMASKIQQSRMLVEENREVTAHIFDGVHSSILDHFEYHQKI